ncbi:TPA: adenylyltransferase/cytidyltransferase family protein [Bacillus cereus]|nr:adenylyltransferase/cytidyltransferase family protein [Bacillus cereus]
MSTFKLGFVVGRFQHLHKQHVRMINTALDICDRVILMVGSSQESGTKRNPFNLYTRMNLIRDVFGHEIEEEKLILAHTDDMTHEDDHSTAWGDFLLKKIDMWRGHYGIEDKVDCFIYGNDEERSAWFNPEDITMVSHVVIARDSVSATNVRKCLVENDKTEWKRNTPSEIHKEYNSLRSELMQIPSYGILNVESTITVAKERI